LTHRVDRIWGPVKADNLMADKLYANQAKLVFDDTPGSFKIGTVPGNIYRDLSPVIPYTEVD